MASVVLVHTHATQNCFRFSSNLIFINCLFKKKMLVLVVVVVIITVLSTLSIKIPQQNT